MSNTTALQEVDLECDDTALEIDELLLKLKDPNVLDKEEVLIQLLHGKNNRMYDIAVAVIASM